jgi:hypothetical protein
MNMPMSLRGVGPPSSAMVNGDRTADSAPNFDAVLSRCGAGDVNGCPTFALYDGLHGPTQQAVLHQVNASFPCNEGLKHDLDAGR